MTVSDYRDIVAALRAVPGVADADVQPDAEGAGLGLLRLGLVPGVDEVAVATTVGRLLRDRFGLGVDADRVQLIEDAATWDPPVETQADATPADATPADATPAVETPQLETAAAEPGWHRRPSIQRMHLVSSGLDVTASVTLAYRDRSAAGEASGTATRSGVQRAVAAATLRAVEELVGDTARFELEHIEVTPTGRDRTVVVGATLLTAAGSERLTGAAAVRDDVRQAVIRATLDAINRRLEPLLG